MDCDSDTFIRRNPGEYGSQTLEEELYTERISVPVEGELDAPRACNRANSPGSQSISDRAYVCDTGRAGSTAHLSTFSKKKVSCHNTPCGRVIAVGD